VQVEHIINGEQLLKSLEIPEEFWSLVKSSWKKREPTLYGSFDLMFDGSTPPKLLEYNADTPTTLIEASVAQWHWKKEVFPEYSQYNIIHEKLINTWKSLKIEGEMHFASVSFSLEDFRTTLYLLDTAQQGGIKCECIKMVALQINSLLCQTA